MPTTVTESVSVQGTSILYIETTTTTDGNGNVTDVAYKRSIYPPSMTTANMPAAAATASAAVWTPAVKAAFNQNVDDFISGVAPEILQ